MRQVRGFKFLSRTHVDEHQFALAGVLKGGLDVKRCVVVHPGLFGRLRGFARRPAHEHRKFKHTGVGNRVAAKVPAALDADQTRLAKDLQMRAHALDVGLKNGREHLDRARALREDFDDLKPRLLPERPSEQADLRIKPVLALDVGKRLGARGFRSWGSRHDE